MTCRNACWKMSPTRSYRKNVLVPNLANHGVVTKRVTADGVFLVSCLSVFFLAGLLYGERFCAAKVVRLCVIRLACNLNAEVRLLQRNAIDQDGDDWQDSLAGELFVFEFANYARSLNRELAQTGRCRRIWSTSTRFSEQTSGMKA